MDNAPSVVKIVKSPSGYSMTRNGQPYFIMGAGGTASRVQLAASGGNSTRTWGADNLEKDLAEAQKAGITVTAGIWLGHKDVFDYGNEALVAKQLQMCKDVVTKYKDHPSILMWAIGNEMDGYEAKTDPRIWKAINDICVAVKKIDPNHPTISVVAEVVGDRIEKMHELCPALDAIAVSTLKTASKSSRSESYPSQHHCSLSVSAQSP